MERWDECGTGAVIETDLDLLYQVAAELARHLLNAQLHLSQSEQLFELSSQLIAARVPEDGVVTLHGDFDQTTLSEFSHFIVFFMERLTALRELVERLQAVLMALSPEYYPVCEAGVEHRLDMQASLIPTIWVQESLRLARLLLGEQPARRVLALHARPFRAIDRVYELYQTEAFPSRFREASDHEDLQDMASAERLDFWAVLMGSDWEVADLDQEAPDSSDGLDERDEPLDEPPYP